jgi:hypothetical protein
MWIELIKRYWLEIAIVFIGSILLAHIKQLNTEILSLTKDNSVLQSKLNESNAYINVQNAAILANQADYNASIAKLPSILHKIDTRYVTKTIEVEKWRDNNETSNNDCNASVDYLNNYQF